MSLRGKVYLPCNAEELIHEMVSMNFLGLFLFQPMSVAVLTGDSLTTTHGDFHHKLDKSNS